jgi:transcriptional regulator with XRE-family HTH domain
MSIGERVRTLRERDGLTQQELADEIGVHSHTVSRIELDRHVPHKKTIRKIAETFDMNYREFMEGRSNGSDPN